MCMLMLSELRFRSKIIPGRYLILCKWHHHICALTLRPLSLHFSSALYWHSLSFTLHSNSSAAVCLRVWNACKGLSMGVSGKIFEHIDDRLQGNILWSQLLPNLGFEWLFIDNTENFHKNRVKFNLKSSSLKPSKRQKRTVSKRIVFWLHFLRNCSSFSWMLFSGKETPRIYRRKLIKWNWNLSDIRSDDINNPITQLRCSLNSWGSRSN